MNATKGLSIVLGAALLLLSGCGFERDAGGPEKTDNVSLELADAKKVNLELDMGAGQMKLAGGAAKLVEGRFTYQGDAWKPLVSSSANGGNATVTIKQPSGISGGSKHYLWELNFNDRVLTDLKINCGAGQATLRLGTLALRNLEVHVGVGQMDLDLNGSVPPPHDYEVTMNGGVGQATVDLPKGVGVYVTAHRGIGSLKVTGLTERDGHWENELFDKAKVNVKVTVNTGIGEVRIRG